MDSEKGIIEITKFLEEKNLGCSKVNYRLRDWLISRQRYWGTPIPIVYCEKCGEVPVPEADLPVKLPYDVSFKHDGASPLAGNSDFLNTTCPKCGEKALRDVDTMDTFVDSSWYYLRFLNPHFETGIFDTKAAKEWTPVDMYVGGAEHATMHLLYARFIHKFLRDLGLVNSDEPFSKLIHQGTITNKGAKMSKSKGNVVNPDSFINTYGSDVFRMYLMFMGPYELGGDWNDKGIVGVDRFVQRLYSLVLEHKDFLGKYPPEKSYDQSKLNSDEKHLYKKVNAALDKFNVELENFRFNTAVAALMELLNEITKSLANCANNIKSYILERFVLMLAPLAPHLGEECWSLLGNKTPLSLQSKWYEPDPEALTVDEVTIVLQVNGKLRSTINLPVDTDENIVKEAVWGDEKVKQHTSGKTLVKEIYIKNKIYNIVVK